jgi:hypothetical protein
VGLRAQRLSTRRAYIRHVLSIVVPGDAAGYENLCTRASARPSRVPRLKARMDEADMSV